MTRIHLAAIVTGVVGFVAAIAIPVQIATTNGTERQANCLAAGGSWLRVANTTAMECRR